MVLIVAAVSPVLYPFRWVSKFIVVAVAPLYTHRAKFQPKSEQAPLPDAGQPATVKVTVVAVVDAIAYRDGIPATPVIAPMDIDCPTFAAVNGFSPGAKVMVTDVVLLTVSGRLSPMMSTNSTTKL